MGGPATLEAAGGPLPEMKFCPSGGIDGSNFTDWLRLDNVPGVAGSWLTPPDALEASDWQRIGKLAAHTLDLLRRRAKRSR